MNRTPKSVTATELNPGSVSAYSAVAKLDADGSVVASHSYAPTGATTIMPIGSDGFFASVADGTVIRLFVIEIGANGNNGPEQEVPGGPFTVGSLPDGAETLTVQL